jgi:phosphoribosylamine-glycine ligase
VRVLDLVEGYRHHVPDIRLLPGIEELAGALRASGGRVLNVCALGATLHEARDVAYAALGTISLEGGFYRTDIGWRALSK